MGVQWRVNGKTSKTTLKNHDKSITCKITMKSHENYQKYWNQLEQPFEKLNSFPKKGSNTWKSLRKQSKTNQNLKKNKNTHVCVYLYIYVYTSVVPHIYMCVSCLFSVAWCVCFKLQGEEFVSTFSYVILFLISHRFCFFPAYLG